MNEVKDKLSGAKENVAALHGSARRNKRFLGEEATHGYAGIRVPQVTRCYESRPVNSSLSDRAALEILLIAAIIASLGVAHLWLAFKTADARVQYTRVQQHRRELYHKSTLLQHEYERMCDIERLRAYGAENLRMVETQPGERVVMSVPDELSRKYLGEAAPAVASIQILADIPSGEAFDQRHRNPMEKLLLKVTDVNKAFAGRD